jgi:hypothetical protein
MTSRLLVALLAALLATHQAAASVGTAAELRRALLSAAAATAEPPSQQARLVEHQLPSPGAVNAADAEADGGSVTFHAASHTVTATNGGQQQVFQGPRPGSSSSSGSSSQPPSWTFNTFGKRYTSGPFAARNVVKEPALAADRRPQPPASSVRSSSGKVVSEIGSGRPAALRPAAAAAAPRLPVSAEDDSVKLGRSLLQQHTQEHAQPAVDAAGGVAAGLQHWLLPEEAFARPPAARHLDSKRLKQGAASVQAQPHSSLRAAALGLESGSSSRHRTVVRLQQQAQQ